MARKIVVTKIGGIYVTYIRNYYITYEFKNSTNIFRQYGMNVETEFNTNTEQ